MKYFNGFLTFLPGYEIITETCTKFQTILQPRHIEKKNMCVETTRSRSETSCSPVMCRSKLRLEMLKKIKIGNVKKTRSGK